MGPHYLIDGYNVIHKIAELKTALEIRLEKSRDLLIHRILNYMTGKKVKMTVVFDGADVGVVPDPYARKKQLKIYYSHSPEKADPLIKKLVRKKAGSEQLILVTEDHELINFARNLGVETMSPVHFYQLLRKEQQQNQLSQKFDKPMTQEEFAEWLRIFGEGEEQ